MIYWRWGHLVIDMSSTLTAHTLHFSYWYWWYLDLKNSSFSLARTIISSSSPRKSESRAATWRSKRNITSFIDFKFISIFSWVNRTLELQFVTGPSPFEVELEIQILCQPRMFGRTRGLASGGRHDTHLSHQSRGNVWPLGHAGSTDTFLQGCLWYPGCPDTPEPVTPPRSRLSLAERLSFLHLLSLQPKRHLLLCLEWVWDSRVEVDSLSVLKSSQILFLLLLLQTR